MSKELALFDTNILINASCQFSDDSVVSVSDAQKGKNIDLKHDEIDSKILNLVESTYHQHYTELIPMKKEAVHFAGDVNFDIDYRFRIYDNGIFIFSLMLFAKGEVSSKKICESINQILNECMLSINDELFTFKDTLKKLIGLIDESDNYIGFKILETYSVINPSKISPEFNQNSIVGSKYENAFYEATIRRIKSIGETNIEISRSEQQNLSVYIDDLVYLNYHNLFVYVVPDKDHLPPIVYIQSVEYFKVYLAKMKYLLFEISEHVQNEASYSNKLKDINESNKWIEKMRLYQLKFSEFFNESVDLASMRLSWFFKAAIKKFGIDELETKIERILKNFESIVKRKLSSKHSVIIERLTISLTVIGLLISIVGILISVFNRAG